MRWPALLQHRFDVSTVAERPHFFQENTLEFTQGYRGCFHVGVGNDLDVACGGPANSETHQEGNNEEQSPVIHRFLHSFCILLEVEPGL